MADEKSHHPSVPSRRIPRSMVLRWPLLALLSCLPLTIGAAEISRLGSLGLTSDYVHRGLSRSSERPALQAGYGVSLGDAGLYTGAWGTTLDTRELGPDFGSANGFELDLLLGVSRPLGASWNWNLNAGRYYYLGDRRILDYDYYELNASLSWQEFLSFSAAWSPDATDHTREGRALTGHSTSFEISGEWPLLRRLSATAGVGYNDLSEVSEVTYTYWSGGVNARFGRYLLSFNRFGTDDDARGRFMDGRADSRFVLHLVASFGGR